jgi:hypothetical protein
MISTNPDYNFLNKQDSPLPGQKAPRTRRRRERKEKTEKFGHGLSQINAEVKNKGKILPFTNYDLGITND